MIGLFMCLVGNYIILINALLPHQTDFQALNKKDLTSNPL